MRAASLTRHDVGCVRTSKRDYKYDAHKCSQFCVVMCENKRENVYDDVLFYVSSHIR